MPPRLLYSSSWVVLLHLNNSRLGPRDDRDCEPAACEQWDSIILSRALGRGGKELREEEIRRERRKIKWMKRWT